MTTTAEYNRYNVGYEQGKKDMVEHLSKSSPARPDEDQTISRKEHNKALHEEFLRGWDVGTKLEQEKKNIEKKETVMSQQWASLPNAASALKVSVRTIERRIKRGELDIRRTNVGREVLVDMPDNKADMVQYDKGRRAGKLESKGHYDRVIHHFADWCSNEVGF